MTSTDEGVASLPVDPTFPPSAYERVSVLLRSGVIGFFVLAAVGMVAELVANPGETVDALTTTNPIGQYTGVGGYLHHLLGFGGDAVIFLGIFIMVAVTIGRVVYAAADFYRGRERILGALCVVVVVLLVVGLVLIGPLVH